MPYTIRQENGKWCVFNKDTGENKGCSGTRAEAQRHMNAMLAGEHGKVNDNKAFTGKLMQDEVHYIPLSTTAGKACANCRWFHAQGDYMDDNPHCHLIMPYPEPILATGYCDRQETNPPPMMPEVEPVPVVIVEPMMEMDDSAEMALTIPKNIFQRVKEFAASLLPAPVVTDPPAFEVFKTAAGRNGWIARHTGKWIDRENEILSEKSHERYVERVQKELVPKPQLWMWHNKGTKHGDAIAVWKSGGFVLAAGLFDETTEGERMFRYYQKHSGQIKLSHMFHYPKQTKIDGVYNEYNTIEITTLPAGAEAFPYTSFEEIQTMALPEVARNMILEAGGQEMLDRALAADNKAETDTKTLDSQGVAWKGYDQYEGALVPAEKLTDLENRLKAAETTQQTITDLNATVKSLLDNVKLLTEQVNAKTEAENKALERINDLEKKLAENSDLKPPASQSTDAVLNQREKSLLDKAMADAQSGDSPSYIEKLLGVTPTIHS